MQTPYFYLVTFEIDPKDEKDFNEIYDTEHIPNILQVDGVLQVIRLKDAQPTAQGWLKYSALYLITQPDLPSTPQWKAKSDLGRWAPLIRPVVKARRQRLGRVVANMASKILFKNIYLRYFALKRSATPHAPTHIASCE